MKHKHPEPAEVKGVKVRIYQYDNDGYSEFKVVDPRGPTRKFLSFSTEEKARKAAKEIARQMAGGELEVLTLRGPSRAGYLLAMQRLEPTGTAIEEAASQFAEAQRILKGVSMVQAASFYAKRHCLDLPKRTVSEVVAELIAAKEAEKVSQVHLDDLRYRLDRGFAADFQKQLSEVTGPQIKDWLSGLNLSGRSQNNFRIALSCLFNFAKKRGYLPKDHDEMETVDRVREREGQIEIFTPEEIGKLLAASDDKLRPFLAVGAFAGLRSAEIERLVWPEVSFESGYITVGAAKAKTGSRRIVPILPALKAWLEPLKKKHGPVCGYGNATNQFLKLSRREDVAVKWKHNGLRHSFCSYRLADIQNAAQVALEAGNSPQMIFRHYRELVTKQMGASWFSVMPKAVTQLVR